MNKEITSLSILQGSFGCPSGQHAAIDPYYDVDDWHEAARGDGGSYSGILETVERLQGESWDDFYQRARARAAELDEQMGCSRCYR